MITFQLIFWFSLFLIIYSYLIFPAILRWLALQAKTTSGKGLSSELPFISVLMAAYNEEAVISDKIRSLLDGHYPGDRMEILVGSDASTDRTNQILKQLQKDHPSLQLTLFEERQGKPGIINHLAEQARGDILVITDANVMLEKDTLPELIGSFRDERVGLVDSRMVPTKVQKKGVGRQEEFYISREGRIKHHESVIWGAMMGPFGGCYAVRKSLYEPVPDSFLVDDFFINMTALKKGYRCISNPRAIAYEEASSDQAEEFRRKRRISAGNFQNLSRFWPMIFMHRQGIGFCFFSHKVLRWFVPFLFLTALVMSILLGREYTSYLILVSVQLAIIISPVIDQFLRKFKIQSLPLRFISHFVLMNLALLAGFFRYMGGIKENVWQPTRRKQSEAEHH